MIFIINY